MWISSLFPALELAASLCPDVSLRLFHNQLFVSFTVFTLVRNYTSCLLGHVCVKKNCPVTSWQWNDRDLNLWSVDCMFDALTVTPASHTLLCLLHKQISCRPSVRELLHELSVSLVFPQSVIVLCSRLVRLSLKDMLLWVQSRYTERTYRKC